MNADAAARLRNSYATIAPRAPQLIDTFYRLLFAAAPPLQRLFPADMSRQRVHMVGAISLIVEHAADLESLAEPFGQMGARHVKYGARPEHYALVRDTLVAAVGRTVGAAWTPQLAEDWGAALDEVAVMMIRGAEGARTAA